MQTRDELLARAEDDWQKWVLVAYGKEGFQSTRVYGVVRLQERSIHVCELARSVNFRFRWIQGD